MVILSLVIRLTVVTSRDSWLPMEPNCLHAVIVHDAMPITWHVFPDEELRLLIPNILLLLNIC